MFRLVVDARSCSYRRIYIGREGNTGTRPWLALSAAVFLRKGPTTHQTRVRRAKCERVARVLHAAGKPGNRRMPFFVTRDM